MSKGPTLAALFLVLLALPVGPGTQVAAATTPAVKLVQVVVGCPAKMQVRPVRMGTCNDGGAAIKSIVWSSWDRTTAKGTGYQLEHSCQPDCAKGFVYFEAVGVTLEEPVRTPLGVLFTLAKVESCDVEDCMPANQNTVFWAPRILGDEPPSAVATWALWPLE